jgi:hypothetical protein
MWVFLKRYFGWYIWLGLYATAVGAFVGMACFSVPILPCCFSSGYFRSALPWPLRQ